MQDKTTHPKCSETLQTRNSVIRGVLRSGLLAVLLCGTSACSVFWETGTTPADLSPRELSTGESKRSESGFARSSGIKSVNAEPSEISAEHDQSEEYEIRPGDDLEIKFYYHPELNETVKVRPDGRISLQLVSETKVAGLAPSKVREQLIAKYASKINPPEIAVIVKTFSSHKVYVDGEVAQPGVIQIQGSITLLQAISSAGGIKNSADSTEVILIRPGQNGHPQTAVIDVEQMTQASSTGADIKLHPMDIVYVPRSPIANVNMWVDSYIRKNLPIPFAITANP